MSLEEQVKDRARKIHAESYPMSIGEIISLYKEDEIDIHPEFQRLFRWSDTQKSKLIESLLLGIPIPPIFVSQRDDGIWDVVDGTQRLSTILEFIGVLKDQEGRALPALTLEETEYLPELASATWDGLNAFTNPMKLDFKRKKLDFQIIKRESDPNTKYDLFQRLNTLGTRLSDQEIRNCLLVMINNTFYQWLQILSNDENFVNCLSFSENQMEQKYDMEIAVRFLVFHSINDNFILNKDISDFITDKIKEFASQEMTWPKLKNTFEVTFKDLNEALGEDCFKKYDSTAGKFKGKFILSAFEVLALGLGFHIQQNRSFTITADKIKEVAKQLWNNTDFISNSGSGSNAKGRLPKMIKIGRGLFVNGNNNN